MSSNLEDKKEENTIQIDEHNYDYNLFNKVTEGKAKVFFHKTKNEVFYNPIQEFNRDLSIAILNTYSTINNNKKLKILEALAASGIRSMRYALEIENCAEIIANDFDKKAVELIDINTSLNKVNNIVKSNCDDATLLMNSMSRNRGTQFDCIDLDPYGSPAAFLDSAIRSVRSGGLLLITATDAGVLCGNGADACFTKYGSVSLRTPCCHELALRILLQSINNHAVRYSKYIVPVLSLSIDFYFRIFVLVYDGQLKAKESINNIGQFYICNDCHSFYQQNYGKTIPTKGNVKFVAECSSQFNLNKCQNCEGSLKLVGPVWTGKLHEKDFILNVLKHLENKTCDDYTTKERMIGMLNLAYEELEDPLYYVIDDICSTMHCETPNHNVFRSAIMNANYQVSYSHCSKNSLKTNAPNNVIWDILKRWIEIKPVKEKWLGSEYKLSNIIKKLPQLEIDFTIRDDCLPSSKKDKLLRFQEPPPFWGPGSKPKRKASDEIVLKEKSKKKSLREKKNSISNNTESSEDKQVDENIKN